MTDNEYKQNVKNELLNINNKLNEIKNIIDTRRQVTTSNADLLETLKEILSELQKRPL